MREHFARLFEHMVWADRRVLGLLNRSPEARQQSVLRLFSHLLAAERVWLLRLRGEDSAVQPIWPELNLTELEELAAANTAGYAEFVDGLREEAFAAEVAYSNSQGVPFRTSASDILTHVALHGSYHRGQIAAAARASGAEPTNTDFITFAREQPHAHGVAAGDHPIAPADAIVIDRLDHLVLTVRDIGRTCDFYTRVLGMRAVSFGEGRVALTFGQQKINLHLAGSEIEPKAAHPVPGSADLCLIARAPLAHVVQHLRASGAELLGGPVERTGALGPMQSVYLRDPDANLLEISVYPG